MHLQAKKCQKIASHYQKQEAKKDLPFQALERAWPFMILDF